MMRRNFPARRQTKRACPGANRGCKTMVNTGTAASISHCALYTVARVGKSVLSTAMYCIVCIVCNIAPERASGKYRGISRFKGHGHAFRRVTHAPPHRSPSATIYCLVWYNLNRDSQCSYLKHQLEEHPT